MNDRVTDVTSCVRTREASSDLLDIHFLSYTRSHHLVFLPSHANIMDIQRLTLDPKQVLPPTRDLPSGRSLPDSLPDAKEVKVHPRGTDGTENASLYFVGTATTILSVCCGPFVHTDADCYFDGREWAGIRIMTDASLSSHFG